MSNQKKEKISEIRLVRGCVVNGEPQKKGSKHKLPHSEARMIVSTGRAEFVAKEPESEGEASAHPTGRGG